VAALVVSSSFGPGRWWSAAVTTSAYIVPILATGALALWGAWRLNRPNDRALKAPRSIRLPRQPLVALTVVMAAGIGRSVAARSTIITSALAPLLVRGAGSTATTVIAFFVMAAAAPVLGANGFAYDGGAAVWLLGKVGHWPLVAARLAATSTWILALAVVATISAFLTGAPVVAAALPLLVLVAIGSAAAGLVPSVKRPMATDFDSFRTQAAPVVSAVGALGRAALLTVAVIAMPGWAAVALVTAYGLVAVVHAHRLLADPVPLASLA
jgi:hypothetical protein